MYTVIVIFQLTIPYDLLRSQFDKTGNAILRLKADNLPTKLLLFRLMHETAFEAFAVAARRRSREPRSSPTPFAFSASPQQTLADNGSRAIQSTSIFESNKTWS